MIYVHVPFCRSFCTYCDFYSEVADKCGGAGLDAEENLFGKFAAAVSKEVAVRRGEISDIADTLYIGGGTPSVLPLSFFSSLTAALRAAGHAGSFREFTVEVNPDDIVEKGEGYVDGLLRLGVNRISMGVQSFDDGLLRWMNRRHDSAAARKAYSILESAGVENISIDLIYGISGLTDEGWRRTIDDALSISSRGVLPPHLSSYQLSVEPGSALAQLVRQGKYTEASDEACSRQYSILCRAMAEAGYHHYEISNFALPGFEAVHNSAYWRHVPYLGLGPGAHSFLLCAESGSCAAAGDVPGEKTVRGVRRWNNPDLKAYLNAAGGGDFDAVSGFETLGPEELAMEKIMLSLRTSDGIDGGFLAKHCDLHALDRALRAGILKKTSEGKIFIPEEHYFVSDGIISDIL